MVDGVIRYAVTLGRHFRHSSQTDRLAFVNVICCPIVFCHLLRAAGYAMRKIELRTKKKAVRDDMKGEGFNKREHDHKTLAYGGRSSG